MMNSIQPGTGVGQLPFGITREHAAQLLGEPSSKESLVHEEDGDETTEVWHYDTRELSLGFDESEEFRLVTLSLTGAEYTLDGEVVIGMDRSTLLALLEKLGETDVDIEMITFEDDDTAVRVGSELLSMNAWLEAGKVVELTCMPGLTEDDDWVWPAHAPLVN